MADSRKVYWKLALRRIELLCLGVGFLCACFCLLCVIEALIPGHVRAVSAAAQTATGQVVAVEPGALLGRLEIPALGLTVPVVEDDGTESLLRGVGHIPGTAMLGGLGTTALAGHRDTFLRPLRRVERNMQILALSPQGTYHYIVDSTEIVTPETVRVLEIRNKPELVLVTCYPFNFIGHAPMRFIVHAHLVSVSPDPLPGIHTSAVATRQ